RGVVHQHAGAVLGGDTPYHRTGAIQVRQVTSNEEGAPRKTGGVDLCRDLGALAAGQVDKGNPPALGRERGGHGRPEPTGRSGNDDRRLCEPHPVSSPCAAITVPTCTCVFDHHRWRVDGSPEWLPSGSRQGRRTDMTSQANHNLAALAEAAFHRLGDYESL